VSCQTLPRDLYEVAADDAAYTLIAGAGKAAARRSRSFEDELLDICREHLTDAQRRQMAEDHGHEELVA
jgi:hypothetical protein